MNPSGVPASRPWHPGSPAPSGPVWAESLYPDQRTDHPNLSDVWKAIRRGRRVGLSVTAAVWALVAAFLVLAPPSYKSSTVLLIDTGALASIAEKYAASDDIVSAFGLPKLANQAVILETVPSIADTAAARLVRTLTPARLEELGIPADPVLISAWMRDDAVSVLAASDKESADIIEVFASGPAPEVAASIADFYAQSYLDMIALAVSRQREAAMTTQRGHVDAASAELATFDQQLGEFLRANGSLSVEQEAMLAAGRISELRAALDDARIDLSTHTARLSSLEVEQDGLDLDRLAKRIASSAEEEISATSRQLAQIELELEAFYAKNPALRTAPEASSQVMKLRADAAALRTRLAQLSEAFVAEVVATGGIDLSGDSEGRGYILNLRRQIAEERVALRAAEARVQAIQGRLSAFETSKQRYTDQSVSLTQLTRGRELAESRLTTEIDRLGELQADRPGDYARRIRAANVPESAAFPKKTLTLVIGFMLGILGGGGAAFAKTRISGRIYEASDLGSAGVLLGGMLPDVSRTAKRAGGKTGEVWVGSRAVSSHLVLASAPNSAEAAMVRKYALGLASRTSGGGVMVFTSADSSVGKSLTVGNVGCALALAGYTTLIVDADPYRQGLGRVTGMTGASRLDITTGQFANGGGLDQFPGALQLLFGLQIYARDSANLEPHLIARVSQLAAHYRQHFDFILIDTPPVAASSIAAGLGRYAERTIGVVGSGKTRTDLLTMAIGELRIQGVEMAELLLNRVKVSEDEVFGHAYSEAHRYYAGGPS